MSVPNRASADRDCPHCKSALPRLATACPACGRWVVTTHLHPAAQVLRAVGYLWVLLSVVGAVALWTSEAGFLGGGIGWIAAVALQGLLIGLVAVVVAENGPRVPE